MENHRRFRRNWASFRVEVAQVLAWFHGLSHGHRLHDEELRPQLQVFKTRGGSSNLDRLQTLQNVVLEHLSPYWNLDSLDEEKQWRFQFGFKCLRLEPLMTIEVTCAASGLEDFELLW
ncbi:hypothetical protein JCM3766R1_006025 [Sporobolomyces carnicolor]